MYERRGSGVAVGLLLLLLAATPAHARKKNFVVGSPFGLGLTAGLENRPNSNFAAGSQTTTSNYANNFAFEPFFNLTNVAFRLHAGWNFYPLLSGAGSDSSGSFTESSDAGTFSYGVRMLLYPFIGQAGTQRFYFCVNLYNGITQLKNSRKYLSGAMFNQTNTERLKGTGLEVGGGIGYEFMLIQNYSMQLELGYTDRSVSSFTYQTSTDVAGTARSSGESAKDPAGGAKGFHVYSPYFQIGLNLNL